MGNNKFGFWNLAAKSFAVFTAFNSLVSNQSKAMPLSANFIDEIKKLSYENFQKRFLTPKLILKLNIENPDNSYLSMHASHSSHASHASYTPSSGHSSHSSHMSSSPTYSPSTTSPVYVPKDPVYTPNKSNTETTSRNKNTFTADSLAAKTLFKGCKGADVRALQVILVKLGYMVSVNGDFDTTTEIAVKKFQEANYLTIDGVVGFNTWIVLQSK